jgi:hypothetical protein
MPPKAKKEKVKKEKKPKAEGAKGGKRKKKRSPIHPDPPSLALFITSLIFTPSPSLLLSEGHNPIFLCYCTRGEDHGEGAFGNSFTGKAVFGLAMFNSMFSLFQTSKLGTPLIESSFLKLFNLHNIF